MSLHGTPEQLHAPNYFNKYDINKYKNLIIHDHILKLEKSIKKTKDTIKSFELFYKEECYNSNNSFDSNFILERIASYRNPSDEKILFEKSNYYILSLKNYYIETKEGNYRNWLYSTEVVTEHKLLQKHIIILEEELRKKIINIGIEIALLRI
jgi:hypothetical protein